MITYLPKTIN